MKKFLLLLVLIVLSGNLQTLFAAEGVLADDERKPLLKALHDKYVIQKTTGAVSESWEFPTIEIVNVGKDDATGIKIIESQFFLNDNSQKLLPPLSISKESIDMDHTQLKTTLESGDSIIVDVTSDELSKISGSYSGKLIFIGDNFEPLDVNLELNIIHDPGELIMLTIAGIISASLVSLIIKYRILVSAITLPGKEQKSLCRHLAFGTFTISHAKQKAAIFAKIGDSIPLDTAKVKETQKEGGSIILKAAYSILIAFAAIPATLFAADVMLGHPVWDLFIAFGIGATIYASKDLLGHLKSSS